MKHLVFFLALFLSFSCFAQKKHTYSNDYFKFRATVPLSWRVFAEQIDTVKNRMIIDWGLPEVYSEVEKTDIENAITIEAFKSSKINSEGDLIRMEYLRIDPTVCALETFGTEDNSRMVYCTYNNNDYKGRKQFIFKNGIGYIVTFMATPGTYDINLPLFEEFFKSMEFSAD